MALEHMVNATLRYLDIVKPAQIKSDSLRAKMVLGAKVDDLLYDLRRGAKTWIYRARFLID